MENITNHFNRLAPDFDSLPFVKARNIPKEIEIIETLIPEIRHQSILDIGCGTGRLTLELQRIGAAAYGIDIAGRMIEIAKSKDPVIFETADFYSFRPRDKFTNAISIMGGAFGLLEDLSSHILTTRNFFRQLNTILRGDGVAVIEFLNQSNVVRHVSAQDIETRLFHFQESVVADLAGFFEKAYTPSELTMLAEDAGFCELAFFSTSESGDLTELQLDSEVGLLKMVKCRDLTNARWP